MAIQRNIGDVVNLQFISNCVTSKIGKEVCEFVWEINGFDKVEDTVVSPIFSSNASKVRWQVKILTKDERQGERSVSVILQLLKSDDFDSLAAKIQLGFLDSNRKIVAKVQNFQKFITGKGYQQFSIRRHEVIHRHRGYLSGDSSLTLYFLIDAEAIFHEQQKYNKTNEIDFSHETRNRIRPANLLVDESDVHKRFKGFLDNEEFTDVTITTTTTSFRVSKIVLAAQSPVFKATFQSNSSDVVQLGDFKDETVKAFLEFLYTGQIELRHENARELLKISDKYEVNELKRRVEEFLLNSLTVENACEILILAHLNSATTLKPQAIFFVNQHKNQVQNTEPFQTMAVTHPIIFRDLYLALT